jgi:hypothetical protein
MFRYYVQVLCSGIMFRYYVQVLCSHSLCNNFHNRNFIGVIITKYAVLLDLFLWFYFSKQEVAAAPVAAAPVAAAPVAAAPVAAAPVSSTVSFLSHSSRRSLLEILQLY